MKEEGEKRFSFFTFPFLVLVSRTNIPFFPIFSKKANGILGWLDFKSFFFSQRIYADFPCTAHIWNRRNIYGRTQEEILFFCMSAELDVCPILIRYSKQNFPLFFFTAAQHLFPHPSCSFFGAWKIPCDTFVSSAQPVRQNPRIGDSSKFAVDLT